MIANKTYRIQGVAPLLLKNGQTADPLNDHTKAIAKISKKRNKTEEDHLALSKLEWYGALYVNDQGVVCVPGENIEGTLLGGAKKFKLGPKFKAGCFVDQMPAIEYDGPKNIDKLWASGNFTDKRLVKIGQVRIVRTRPIFREWGLTFTVQFSDIDGSDMDKVVEMAGQVIGLCDYRPRFGRFIVL